MRRTLFGICRRWARMAGFGQPAIFCESIFAAAALADRINSTRLKIASLIEHQELHRMNKTLNVRLLVCILVVIALGAGAIHRIHRHQANRQADAFLHQADAAEKQSQLGRAAKFLLRYLPVRPDHLEARARLALLLEQTARSRQDRERAFYELEQVLRDSPDRDDVRRRDIALAMLLGRFVESRGHIDYLVAAHPNDGSLRDLKGQCLAAAGDFAGAESAFADAVKTQPDLIEAYRARAYLLRRRLDRPKDADKADKVIESMLKENDASATAHLAAADD